MFSTSVTALKLEGHVAAWQSGYHQNHHHEARAPQENNWGNWVVNSRGAYARKIRGDNPREKLSNTDVADRLRRVMRETYGESRSAAKEAAQDANQSPRAAENWMAGDNPMSLTAFLNAYHGNGIFKAWARKILLMEEEIDPQFQAELHRFIAAAQRVSAP